jgi:protease-4
MDQNQTPEPTVPSAPFPEPKKSSKNPLAIVLGLSAALFGIFLIISIGYLLVRGASWKGNEEEAVFNHSKIGEYIAVIELKGPIMDSKKILKQLNAAEEENGIKGVVLRLNSPGGAVAPSQEIYETVKAFKKPLVVSMDSVAASGAYYIASGAKKVFANAGTLTGSIGVIMEFINLKKLYDWAKVERYSIKTGKFKDSGAEYRDMNPEERAYFQDLVMDTLEQFKGAVAQGRKLTPEEVNAVADGRVFSGEQAKKLKLVDAIGTLEDAIRFVAEEAKIKGKPKVVHPVRRVSGFKDLLFGSPEEEDSEFAEGSSFVDRLVSKIADRLTGVKMSERTILPPGLYWIWNGSR